ncbi:hypothetical protein [Bacillus halotolerans]|uniref:hypothetical protein n=2 Tax=Bacillus halotolerans TaxID=260554 RepID=UPI00192C3C31|nr:hypothetical protein [Bacillus halotolerans]MBL4968913.1 hypothetical protein [Bacillus halotolerans]MBL4972976.1 hypothetical protein [Bacillus halotolerans]
MSEKVKFKEGQQVIMHVNGAGVVSKERHRVLEVDEKGIVSLEDSDKEFDLDGKWLGVDNFFGFNFWIEPVTEQKDDFKEKSEKENRMEYTKHGNLVEGYITFNLYFETFEYKEDSLLEQVKFTTVKELFNMMQPDYIEELMQENGAEQVEIHDITFRAKEGDTEAFITMYDNSGNYRISTILDVSGLDSEYKETLLCIKDILDKKI